MPIHIEHLLLFAVSIPVAVLSIGLLGLVLASTFVLYRSASSLSQALEYPIWTITGMLIPLSLLPGWIGPIAWVLAPTWGMEAVRNSALGGDVLGPLLLCLALSLAYTALSMLLLHHFERLAREGDPLTDMSVSRSWGGAGSARPERTVLCTASEGRVLPAPPACRGARFAGGSGRRPGA